MLAAFFHMGFIHTFSEHCRVLIEKEWSRGNGCVWSKLAIKPEGLEGHLSCIADIEKCDADSQSLPILAMFVTWQYYV